MKRCASLILCFTLILGLLSGCGGSRLDGCWENEAYRLEFTSSEMTMYVMNTYQGTFSYRISDGNIIVSIMGMSQAWPYKIKGNVLTVTSGDGITMELMKTARVPGTSGGNPAPGNAALSDTMQEFFGDQENGNAAVQQSENAESAVKNEVSEEASSTEESMQVTVQEESQESSQESSAASQSSETSATESSENEESSAASKPIECSFITTVPVGVRPIQAAGAFASTEIYWEAMDILYAAGNVIDGDTKTTWQEDIDNDPGINEWIEIYFDKAVDISVISLWLGDGDSQYAFNANSRPRALHIQFSSGEEYLVFFESVFGFQTIQFSDSIHADSVRFTVKDAYWGDQYQDTAISEIVFYGK